MLEVLNTIHFTFPLWKGKGPDDLLFQTNPGTPVRVRNMRRDWFDLAGKGSALRT